MPDQDVLLLLLNSLNEYYYNPSTDEDFYFTGNLPFYESNKLGLFRYRPNHELSGIIEGEWIISPHLEKNVKPVTMNLLNAFLVLFNPTYGAVSGTALSRVPGPFEGVITFGEPDNIAL